MEVGGGRITGECCHFIDLLRFLADSPIISFDKNLMNSPEGDTVTINLKFHDGSIAQFTILLMVQNHSQKNV